MAQVAVVQQIGQNAAGYYNVQTTDGEWYGAGKLQPQFAVGDQIQFDYILNGKYKNFVFDSLQVVGKGGAPAAAAPASRPTSPRQFHKKTSTGSSANNENWEARAKYWDDKEKRDILTQNEIRFQASRNAAIQFIDVLLKNNLLEIDEPKKKNMTKADVVEVFLNKYTLQFYDETLEVNSVDEVEPDTQTNFE